MSASTLVASARPIAAHAQNIGPARTGASSSAFRGSSVVSRPVCLATRSTGMPTVVASSSKEEPSFLARVGTGMAALTLAATLQTATVLPAAASEIDVLTAPVPSGYFVDDGGLLTRASQATINKISGNIEKETGYKIVVVTLRKLQVETDPFAFADKVLEKWYPTAELGNKKAVLLVVKTTKEGALSAGPELNKKLGALVDSVTGDNIPVYAEQEKFGEAIGSSLVRIQAKLEGKADPGPPSTSTQKGGSNFKSKEQTEDRKGIYTTVVGGLLVIAFVVPMVQYYGYIAKDRS